jgi:hypothetical protein
MWGGGMAPASPLAPPVSIWSMMLKKLIDIVFCFYSLEISIII